MPMRVLVGPGESNFTSDGYARTYNLLTHLPDDLSVDAIVGNVQTAIDSDNIRLHEIQHQRQVRYKIGAYAALRQHLRTGGYDIYHHVNMNVPDYDPVLLGGFAEDTPVILGPAERGHDVPPDSLKILIDALFGADISLSTAATLHETIRFIRRPFDGIREQLFERTLQRADRIVAVNEETKEYYGQFFDEEQIEVIPYGVDLDHYQYSPRGGSLDLLTVGRLISRKGISDLLEAMQAIVKEYPSAHLQIVGDGPFRNELEQQASELGVDESVTFHGRVPEEELLKRYQESRAFVHPSHSEGFPHVRLEAMASGCPVIGTDVTGAAELTRDSVDGFIVPSGKPERLAEAAIDLLGDRKLATEMGENARDRVEERHDWLSIADQYADLYESVGKTS